MRDMAKFADLCHDMVAEVDAHILFGCEVRGKEVVSQYDAGNVPASALRCISALERGRRRWQRDDIFTLVVLLSLPSLWTLAWFSESPLLTSALIRRCWEVQVSTS